MATQTPAKVSLLTTILQYFEMAAALGMEIPEQHVVAISTLIETLTGEVASGVQAIQQAHQSLTNASSVAASAPGAQSILPGGNVVTLQPSVGSGSVTNASIPQPPSQLGSTVLNPIIPNA